MKTSDILKLKNESIVKIAGLEWEVIIPELIVKETRNETPKQNKFCLINEIGMFYSKIVLNGYDSLILEVNLNSWRVCYEQVKDIETAAELCVLKMKEIVNTNALALKKAGIKAEKPVDLKAKELSIILTGTAKIINVLSEHVTATPEGFKKMEGYEKGDEKAPFFSEAFLYVLLGKEDARSILYPFYKIADMLSNSGIDSEEIVKLKKIRG